MNHSIKKNFAFKSILTLSTYVMGFITFPYVSRVLGVEYLGLVNFIDNTASYFLLFATLGIELLGVREIAVVKEYDNEKSLVFSRILGLNVLLTIIVLVVYFIIVAFSPKLYQYSELFYIGAVKILFTAFLIEWFFTGIENFKYITIRSLIVKALYVLSVYVFIRNVNDYKLYFFLTVGVVVVNSFVNIIYVRRFVCIQWRELIRLTYMKQNIILGVYSIMTSMYLTFNVMFLGIVADNIQVGYYVAAFKLYTVILGFFTAFTNVMLPRMSSVLSDGDLDSFRLLIDKSLSLVSLFSIPIILCCIVLAPQIIYILSGTGYEHSITLMRILMPAVLFVGIAQVLAVQVLVPMKYDKVLLIASFVGAITSLLINFLCVPKLQSTGTAIVLICSECIVTTIYIIYIIKRRLICLPIATIMKSLFISLPCALICWLSGYYIDNSFIAILVAILLASGCWILLNVRYNTIAGKLIINHLKIVHE